MFVLYNIKENLHIVQLHVLYTTNSSYQMI